MGPVEALRELVLPFLLGLEAALVFLGLSTHHSDPCPCLPMVFLLCPKPLLSLIDIGHLM